MSDEPDRPPNHPALLPRPAAAGGDLRALAALVETLRGPRGCPWDREQSAADLRPYLLEEAHEVADALDRGAWDDLRGELGDLLFQIVFLASLAAARGAFTLGEVVDAAHQKMVERHPHVFDLGLAGRLDSAGDVRQAWEKRKAVARAQAAADGGPAASLLEGVSPSLPALVAAFRLSEKAGGVGFDWPDAAAVLAKVEEEIGELRPAVERGDRAAAGEELGDLLFALANLGRKLRVDPEASLARANLKFRRRFGSIERRLAARGRSAGDASTEELEALWEEAKSDERAQAGGDGPS